MAMIEKQINMEDTSLPLDFLPVDTLIGYRLKRRLGRGGAGVVYLAEREVDQTDVAIKFMPMERDNKLTLGRYHRESRITRDLDSPHIVRTFDSGEVRSLYYIVMEYVDGEPLDVVINVEGLMRPERALGFTRQVAVGLAASHRLGILHRDIKPSNLLLSKDGALKISDFGIAKMQGDETLTQQHTLTGTIHFIAPEQLKKGYSPDIRIDIYALGVTLFKMLTGRYLFMEQDFRLALTKKIIEPPPSPREFRPELSDDVAKLCLKMCAREPADRFRTPEDLTLAIEETLRSGRQTTIEFSTGANTETVELDEAAQRPPAKIPKNLREDIAALIDPAEAETSLVALAAGEPLFYEGTRTQDLFVLLFGELSVYQAGRQLSVIAEQGEIVGELSYLLDIERTATVVADQPTLLYRVESDSFEEHMRQSPNLAVYLMKCLAQRLVDTSKSFSRSAGALASIRKLAEEAGQK